MQILPFQPEIVERMLAGTNSETIHRSSAFAQTANGYWLAWHDGIVALLTPDSPPDIPCFWVEGTQNLAELVALVGNGGPDEVEKFDGDDDSWHEATAGYSGHGYDGHCGCGH